MRDGCFALSYGCLAIVNVLWFFLMEPWVGLQCVIVVFPDHTHFLIYCLMYFLLFVGVLCLYLFCYALLCVITNFAIILKRKIKLVALLVLPHRCIVTINVRWLFLTVQGVGLQCMIVVFPDHSHLLFIYCLMVVLCLSLFWYALLCILSSFAIILKRGRGLVALLCLYCFAHVLLL